MPFVPIANTAKVEIVGHHSANLIPIVNVVHAACSNPATLAELTNILSVFEVTWGGGLNTLANEWVGDFIRVTDLNTSTGAQITGVTIAGAVGSNGVGGPASNCALIKLTSILRSRSGRGRIFVSPIAAVNIDKNGIVAAGERTALDTLWTAVNAALLASVPASRLVVASRVLHGSNNVATISTEALMASQRRRINR